MNFAFQKLMMETVKKAAVNPENRYAFDIFPNEGVISWSFVDSDTYMTMSKAYPEMEDFDEVYYSLFDNVCDRVEAQLEAK